MSPHAQHERTRLRRLVRLTVWGAVAAALLSVASLRGCVLFRVPEMFRLNKERQEQGYYMGEFEFKMLGLAYLLDKGEYANALVRLRDLHEQLATTEGLIKVPQFENKQQELEFYLSLQDPQTGAFMDASYPYCTYEGPTGNVLEHLEALAKETGQPLRLKYPLKFFDEINTPDTLRAFLDDVSYVGWLGARWPQTSFHIARNHLSYAEEGSILDKNSLYTFSPEWRQALLQWFYDNQDPETGFWGPRSRGDKKLLKLDLNNTSTILRSFVAEGGDDSHASLPLRYKSQAFATALDALSEPMPSDDALDELHEWALAKSKGLKTLLRYLWRDASSEHKKMTRKVLDQYVRVLFDRYYIPHEGAFSFYPNSEHATLDGTGSAVGIFRAMGAFSRARQERLWQTPGEEGLRARHAVSRISEAEVNPLMRCDGTNSVRLYEPAPTAKSYTANVSWVVYPKKTTYLDAADMLPRMQNWVESTSQSMGNWVSREGLFEGTTGVKPAKVITHNFPLGAANAILKQHGEVTLIAFDVLQIPTCQVTFTLKQELDSGGATAAEQR